MACIRKAPSIPTCQTRCTAGLPIRRILTSSSRQLLSPFRSSKATETETETGITGSASPSSTPSSSTPSPALPQWNWNESDDCVNAHAALLTLLVLGNIPLIQEWDLADLPYFVGLAVCTIYIGSHRALSTKQRQQISLKEGALAPVFASAALFGAYLVIKFFPDFNIQTFLNCYFWLLGCFAINGGLNPVLRKVGGPLGQKSLTLNLPEGFLLDETGKSMTNIPYAPSDVAALVAGISLSSIELGSHHTIFALSNMIACFIAADILQLVGLRSFRTAGLLLIGLLAYDVFWVFGSPKVIGDNVMLTVATSDMIVGPTRLLFPKLPGGMGEAASFPYSLLGLGDVAIPGLLACLALRYDSSRIVDMGSRAHFVIEAMKSALASADQSLSPTQMGNIAAQAAATAYDEIYDVDTRRRDATTPGFGGSAEQALPNAASPTPPSPSTSSSSSSSAITVAENDEFLVSKDEMTEQQPRVSAEILQQRTYFGPVIGAYVFGLLTAFAANSITHLGQPALLYIVPSTLGAVVLTALSRRELGRVWSFNDVPTFGVPDMKDLEDAAKSK